MKALVVEKDKLRKNIDIVKKRADHAMIFGVLKGNGYGLGLIELARILRDDGISRFAVTEPSDALRLRGAGFCDEEILIIRSAADEEDIKTIIEACATATVGSSEAAAALNGVAERDGIVIDVHIEIDTGRITSCGALSASICLPLVEDFLSFGWIPPEKANAIFLTSPKHIIPAESSAFPRHPLQGA